MILRNLIAGKFTAPQNTSAMANPPSNEDIVFCFRIKKSEGDSWIVVPSAAPAAVTLADSDLTRDGTPV